MIETGYFIIDNETEVRIGFFNNPDDRIIAFNRYVRGVKNARIDNSYGEKD